MRNQTLKSRHWIVDSKCLTLNLAFPQGLFLKLAEEGAVDEELFVNPEVKFQTPNTKQQTTNNKQQTTDAVDQRSLKPKPRIMNGQIQDWNNKSTELEA